MTDITIRGYENADWESAADLLLQPRCIAGTLRLPHESRDAIKARLDHVDANRRRLAALVDSRVVGLLSLHRGEGRRIHTGEFGLFVHDDFHGQGVGRRLMAACIDLADNWLGITRIELSVYVDNAPAIALYESCGFEIEGTARNFCLRDGVLIDAYYMARLKP
jgi:L-phenylalanine/L-methionine N-acetyltransferase